ncbi:hypothetical protein RRG08_034414 [Elysia crispata]|uniref:Uncharacterized protein n=1 Tax=Elysia crispata TaxID=231223 RepID=A0AAE0YCW6_9GAST|nr:hypothetical protein RRG08_034414 [Elysia crispata]
MDPISRSIMKSTLGPELFDMDSSSGTSGNTNSYGTEGIMGGISNYLVQSMLKPPQWGPSPGFLPPLPTFKSTNIVTPSAKNPSKGTNVVNPYNSAPFAVSPRRSSDSVVSPAAPLPIGQPTPSAPSPANPSPGPAQTSFSSGTRGLAPFSSMRTTRRSSFFERFMMMRLMEMMEIF